MDADIARKTLMAQHGQIRDDLNRCCVLAQRLRSGEPVVFELDLALTMLRNDVTQHNATEGEVIGPLLRGLPGWGDLLIDRMLEEHLAEHAVFWEMLSGTVDEVAARIVDLTDDLEAHMAAEERTFLSPLVLCDDVIACRRVGSRP